MILVLLSQSSSVVNLMFETPDVMIYALGFFISYTTLKRYPSLRSPDNNRINLSRDET